VKNCFNVGLVSAYLVLLFGCYGPGLILRVEIFGKKARIELGRGLRVSCAMMFGKTPQAAKRVLFCGGEKCGAKL
jgi:hypothetical protein